MSNEIEKKTEEKSFMSDKWGWDPLNTILTILGVLLTVLGLENIGNYKFAAWIIMGLGLFALGFMVQRTFSTDFKKCSRQLSYYMLRFPAAITTVRIRKEGKKGNKEFYHIYYKCQKCKTLIKVPISKGKLIIECPTCGKEEIVDTDVLEKGHEHSIY